MPEEIDMLERRQTQLEIEREALKEESDPKSAERLAGLEAELAEIREELAGKKARWTLEKESIERVREQKRLIEELGVQAEQATRTGDLQRAAEISYGQIPKAQEELEAAEAELARMQEDESFLTEEVGPEDVAEVVANWTGIPVARMLDDERDRLMNLEDHLHERVVSQDEAITAISNAVRRSRAGLQDPNRPVGSFIFLGPTGVGKTETARALAEFLFDDEDALVRLDMSEYGERHAVARLIGAPPGYVGYEEGGQLTEAVRRRPYSVVLFDEIEKAHPDVFNVLLQVLDDGRLTDGQGRTVDFKNTMIVLTSNLGSEFLAALPEGASAEDARSDVMEVVRASFRPEFLNRLDEIILFNRLGRAQMGAIVEIQLGYLRKLLADRRIDLALTDQARTWLGNAGYDPVYGARPLKRTIQKNLQDQLATMILEGRLKEGETAHVEVKDGNLTIEPLIEAAAA